MILLKTKNYRKNEILLSKKDKVLLIEQERLLQVDMFDPKLHTKQLKGFRNDKVFSFRVTRTYRGIFRLQEQDIILLIIGHRKDIYKLL